MNHSGAPAEIAPAAISPSASRYLEAAYYISQEGEVVRPGRLADWLGVAPPTVTQALARLTRDGLVRAGPERSVEFTDAGLRAAEDIVRRHRVAEVWLNRVLGLDWVTADAEAQQLSHALSDRVLDRLQKTLGNPAACPHGNSIPGVPQPARRLSRLTDLDPDRPARIGRISEVAEHEAPQLLTLLYAAGLIPGAEILLREGSDAEKLVVVGPGGTLQRLPEWAASAIWVDVGPSNDETPQSAGTSAGQAGDC